MSITVRNVTKRFGDFVAVDDVSLEIPSGCLVALLGPSGCGKTTLLRVIAGLEHADSGSIQYEDEDLTNQKAADRQVGFVFQHYALFRNMSVFENIAFGLRVRKTPGAEVRARVNELLSLVRLDGLGQRYPQELSGGQRQRVGALARALAVKPRMLLLDEPFGALDAKVRQELRSWLRRLHEEMHVTTVFVTHDQEEAFEVSDRVVVMRSGRVEQEGTPQQIFDHPATPFVMSFLGNVNVFQGRAADGRVRLGPFDVAYPDYPHAESRDATGYVRPHELELHSAAPEGSHLPVRVTQITPAGALLKVRTHSEQFGVELTADVTRERAQQLNLTAGQTVYLSPRSVRVFLPETA